jgi:hypothetical protein
MSFAWHLPFIFKKEKMMFKRLKEKVVEVANTPIPLGQAVLMVGVSVFVTSYLMRTPVVIYEISFIYEAANELLGQ